MPSEQPRKDLSIVNLLEQIIIFKGNKVYNTIFEILKPVIFYNIKGKNIDKYNFYNWLFSWFWTNKSGKSKLFTSYEKLIEKIENGNLKSNDDQLKYFKDYCSVIIRNTAIPEYLKEKNTVNKNVDIIYPSANFTNEEADTYNIFDVITKETNSVLDKIYKEETIKIISKALNQLPEKYSVSLVLKSKPIFQLIGLSEKQFAWLSKKSGLDINKLKNIIDNEFQKNFDKKFPITSKFIANLLNTSSNNIDKRSIRALEKLKILLNFNDFYEYL